MAGLIFEWDEDKAQHNLDRHGVAFVGALAMFEDPRRIERSDLRWHPFPPALPQWANRHPPAPAPFRRSGGPLHGMRGALLFATGTSDVEQHEEIRRHEQGGEAASLPQSRIMLRPVRDPVSRLRNMMTMCGVMLEGHNSFQS